MNSRVKKAEQPDGRSHEAHSSPHAHHRAGMVISLKGRAALSLGQDNDSVDDLVELGQVEEPSVESQTLVPKSTADRCAREAALEKRCGANPAGSIWRVGDRVAQTSWAVQLAKRVDDANQTVGTGWRRDRTLETIPHADKCPGRVYGEEDIVQNDEPLEDGRLRDCPRLVASRDVDAVQNHDGDGVDRRNRKRDPRIIDFGIDAQGDRERRSVWRGASCRGRKSCWVGRGRELEEGGRRQGEVDVGRHDARLRPGWQCTCACTWGLCRDLPKMETSTSRLGGKRGREGRKRGILKIYSRS